MNVIDVYIYLRKSRKDLEAERKATTHYDTLQRHREILLAFIRKEGYNIAGIYEEVVSGESIAERPQLRSMLSSIEQGAVDAVVVVDLDRLGRGDMYDQGVLDRAFRYSGTKIITPAETYDPDSETWELVFGIKSLVAREELKAITRRMQGGRRKSATEGKSITKRPPYGYARDKDLKLYPDEETAWVVRKMFEMMRDGKGRNAIGQELDKLGIKPPAEGRTNWSPSSISAIIKNEVYVGRIIWGQVKYVKRDGKYVRVKQPRENWIIAENAHEPLVSQELFDAANQTHAGRYRPSTVVAKKLSNPLAGILRCSNCGFVMRYQPRKSRPTDSIGCVQPMCKGIQRSISFPVVEKRVIEALANLLARLEYEAASDNATQEVDTASQEVMLDKKVKEFEELQRQKNQLHDFLERGIYSVETFMERQKNLSERIRQIEDHIANIKSELDKVNSDANLLSEIIPKLRDVIEDYPSGTIEEKNELLKQVLDKVVFTRKPDWRASDMFEIQIYPKF